MLEDDVFGEDPTINALEQKGAELFGKECGLYCPSGTMTNQIALNILTKPYEEVICYEGSHIYKYEGGGAAGNSMLSFRLIKGSRGKINSDDVLSNLNPDDQHFPDTSVVALENTVNKAGGSFYSIKEIDEVISTARSNGLKTHLDGARVFNAMTESGDKAKEYGSCFDTISVCLSKGLGAPVGSLLLYDKNLERLARRRRKTFGGAMRQAGFLAAAGIYALDNHVERLREDHKRAKQIGSILEKVSYVEHILPIDTNIVIFRLEEGLKADQVLVQLENLGVKGVAFGPREIRFVTHLDINDDHMEGVERLLLSFDPK